MTTQPDIEAVFTRADGTFLFAKWHRPIAPVIFGVDDATLPVLKGALEAIVMLAGHQMAETDPELGSNLMMFFVRDWTELRDVPDLGRLIPGLSDILDRLEAADANQYRVFRFEEDGAIRAAFAFVRMDAHMSDAPAEALALGQAVQLILLWSDTAFTDHPALVQAEDGSFLLRPSLASLIQAAYDPLIPVMSQDAALSYRLAARLGGVQ